MGATGSGKSTLVDGIINYASGVSWKDPYRFTLVDLEKEEQNKNQVMFTSVLQLDFCKHWMFQRNENKTLRLTASFQDQKWNLQHLSPSMFSTFSLKWNKTKVLEFVLRLERLINKENIQLYPNHETISMIVEHLLDRLSRSKASDLAPIVCRQHFQTTSSLILKGTF